MEETTTSTPWFKNAKNLLIIALVFVVLAQSAFLLLRGKGGPDGEEVAKATAEATAAASATPEPTPLPTPTAVPQVSQAEMVSVVAVTTEPELRRYVLVVFDRPVGEELVGKDLEDPPVKIEPRLYGVWTWISPYVLRFDAEEPLLAGGEYNVIVDRYKVVKEGQEFSGETNFTLKTGTFAVKQFTLKEEPVQHGEAMVEIHGRIEFTYSVDPMILADRIKAYDSVNGKEVPLEIYLSGGYRSRWIYFNTQPVQKRAQRRDIKVVIPKGLTPAMGNITLDQDVVKYYPLVLDTQLKLRSASGDSNVDQATITLSFSTPVTPETARKYISLEPQVDFDISSSGSDLYLSGDFEPGREYRVTVEHGLPAADGAVLDEKFFDVVMIPNLEPVVKFQDPGIFLSKNGFKTLAVESVNTDKVMLKVDRVYSNNLFLMLNQYYSYILFQDTDWMDEVYHNLGDRIAEEELAVSSEDGDNSKAVTRIKLDEYIPENEHGLYRVFASLPDDYQGGQRWVLITDLGLVAKQGEDDFLVWISSFENLSPKPGVKVSLISDQNQVIAQGVTDAEGLWHATDLAESYEDNRPYLVVAETDDDFSFLILDQFLVDTTGEDVGGATVQKEGYTAFLYGQRDIYRPGETLQGLAIVRDAMLDTPDPMPLKLVQLDPEGKEISTQVLKSDDKGLAEFSLDIPDYALTGKYVLQLVAAETVIGSYRFQVEEFMPDRIKVEIDTPKAEVSIEDGLGFDVASRYFFGPPASGLPVETRVVLSAAPFMPKGFEDYNFGDPDSSFTENEIFMSEDSLDDEGNISYMVGLADNLRPPAALTATISSRVRERGGRGVSAMQRVTVHAYPYYVGLKCEEEDYYATRGEEVKFRYVLVDPEGNELTGGNATAQVNLVAEFYKDRWQTVLRRTASGAYRYVSEKDSWLSSSTNLQGASGGEIAFTPQEYGSYRLVLRDENTGATAQVEFYAGGGNYYYNPWAIKNPGKIELTPDKEEYMPGETATFLVKAPFGGRLLISVEGQGVLDTQVHDMEGNTAEIKIPVKAEYSPNVYVSALLVRSAKDLEPGSVARAAGYAPFYVDRESNKPKITLYAPEEVRPETSLTVTIESEPNATVTLAAVDEGILQLIGQETPDPFPFFYAKRALGVDSYDIFSFLFPELDPFMGKSPEGGDGALDKRRQFVRTEGIRRVKPVAYWSGPLTVNATGQVEYTMELPQFQGALRLMCVAVNDRRFSSNHAMTRVRTPLVITPTFPRFLSMEETVKIPVAVRNDTESDGSFQVTLHIQGPANVQERSLNVDVPKGKEKVAYFTMVTGREEGKVTCLVTAEGNNETAKSEVELGVRSAYPARTESQAGRMDDPSTLMLVMPGQGELLPDTVRREIRIGALPMIQFSGALKYLLRYPYGCVEQTVSSVFPLLYFKDLARELDPELFENRSWAHYVQRAISKLQRMQVYEGGFGMWPGSDYPYLWGTIYATHFLLEARNVGGVHVSDTVIERALDYLAEEVRGQESYTSYEIERTCYALYVLAKGGKADKGTMDYLRRQHMSKLRNGAGVHLAAAYALTGDMRAVEDLIAGNWNVQEVQRTTGGNLDSTLRNLAMRLLALLETVPNDPRIPGMVEDLTKRMHKQYYYTTQEAVFSFLALGKFFSTQRAKAPFSGMVFLGDDMVGEFSSDKVFYATDLVGDEPIKIVMDQGYEPGAAFYSVQTRGVPTKEAYKPQTNNISVTREFLTRSGEPVDLNSLKQGDLIVMRTSLRSLGGSVDNIVVTNLLPTGLEVENPRLESTEKLPWIGDELTAPAYQDLRDDRVLLFLDLPGNADKPYKNKWRNYYSLLRVVTPGDFTLPPVQAEAMYDPETVASGPAGRVTVLPDAPVEDPASDKPLETLNQEQERAESYQPSQ